MGLPLCLVAPTAKPATSTTAHRARASALSLCLDLNPACPAGQYQASPGQQSCNGEVLGNDVLQFLSQFVLLFHTRTSLVPRTVQVFYSPLIFENVAACSSCTAGRYTSSSCSSTTDTVCLRSHISIPLFTFHQHAQSGPTSHRRDNPHAQVWFF